MLLFFQVRIVATDLGGKSDEILINVTVNHNLNAPIISPLPYQRTIPETWNLGDQVVQILVSDADINVSTNILISVLIVFLKYLRTSPMVEQWLVCLSA